MMTEVRSALSICAFEVMKQGFAIDSAVVLETVSYESFTPLPTQSRVLMGVANYRNTVLPLIDPRPLLAPGARKPYDGETYMVIENGEYRVGIGIEGLVGVYTPDYESRFEYPLNDTEALFSEIILLHSGSTVALIDSTIFFNLIKKDLN